MTAIVGIDPGLSGAIAMLVDRQLVELHDMPVLDGKVSPQLFGDLVHKMNGGVGAISVAVIEEVHSMPRQGIASTFKFGRSLGVEFAFGYAGIPIRYVTPAEWKRDMRLGKRPGETPAQHKARSRQRALQLWPGWSSHFDKARHDGRAEAALIALWHYEQEHRKP